MEYLKEWREFSFVNESNGFKIRSFEKDREQILKLEKDIENIKQKMNDKYQDKLLEIFINLLEIIRNHLDDYEDYDDIADYIDFQGYNLYYGEADVVYIDLNNKEIELEEGTFIKFKNVDIEYLYDWISTIIKIKPVYTSFNIDIFKKINH